MCVLSRDRRVGNIPLVSLSFCHLVLTWLPGYLVFFHIQSHIPKLSHNKQSPVENPHYNLTPASSQVVSATDTQNSVPLLKDFISKLAASMAVFYLAKFLYNFTISSSDPNATWVQTSSITSPYVKVVFIGLNSPSARDEIRFSFYLDMIHLNELPLGTQQNHAFIIYFLYLYFDFPLWYCNLLFIYCNLLYLALPCPEILKLSEFCYKSNKSDFCYVNEETFRNLLGNLRMAGSFQGTRCCD